MIFLGSTWKWSLISGQNGGRGDVVGIEHYMQRELYNTQKGGLNNARYGELDDQAW